MMQAALRPGQGWATLDEVFRQLPGPRFEVHQTVDEQGMPKETAAQLSKSSPGAHCDLHFAHMRRPVLSASTIFNHTRVLRAGSKPAPGRRRVVVVMFVGGITFAEVAALRFLSRQPSCDADFVIATTKVVNGNSFLSEFIPSSVQTCMAQAALQ